MAHLPRYKKYQINKHTRLTLPQQLRVHCFITKPKETKAITLKQKVYYVDEELSVTKTKMSRMDIDMQQEKDTQQEKRKAIKSSIQGNDTEHNTEQGSST